MAENFLLGAAFGAIAYAWLSPMQFGGDSEIPEDCMIPVYREIRMQSAQPQSPIVLAYILFFVLIAYVVWLCVTEDSLRNDEKLTT